MKPIARRQLREVVVNRSELMRFARAGAETRIAFLEAEIAAILRHFPDLQVRCHSASAKADDERRSTTQDCCGAKETLG